jgi:hypothetical protein
MQDAQLSIQHPQPLSPGYRQKKSINPKILPILIQTKKAASPFSSVSIENRQIK